MHQKDAIEFRKETGMKMCKKGIANWHQVHNSPNCKLFVNDENLNEQTRNNKKTRSLKRHKQGLK